MSSSSSVKWKHAHPEQAKINQNKYNDKHRDKRSPSEANIDSIVDRLLSSSLSVLDVEIAYGKINNLIIKSK
jgi:hypothetical protein